ncbi:MAG: amylo-alpha-1,6-glucosidase, partial [Candidatus Dormibacteraceae bacterium]
ADATPLFIMLIGEIYRWGFADKVRSLLPNVHRAIDWMENYGDRDNDGFIEYQRATENGLPNQGWKDDLSSISFVDGELAQTPIALAEVQGYAYAAYLAHSTIAAAESDAATAQRSLKKAQRLKDLFNKKFWAEELGYIALALDKDKRLVNAKASNMGHCLWAGLLEPEKAALVGRQLISPDMFTGWGIRTLGASAARFNPASYHTGSVWPHDTAIIVAGLMKYGLVDAAHRILLGMLGAAEHLNFRLPELFSGFTRQEFDTPISYPAACEPQAWAAAAPLLLTRAMLRLEPDLTTGTLALMPDIPHEIGEVVIRNMQIGMNNITITANVMTHSVTGLPEGIRLVEQSHRQPPIST